MLTLDEMLAERGSDSRTRIESLADELRQEVALSKLREELNIPPTGQPGAKEATGNPPHLPSLKRYVETLGGELNGDAEPQARK